MATTEARSTVLSRIRALLADGKPHSRAEVKECLYDELAELATIRKQVSRLRERLRPLGQDIVCVLYRFRICYQQVIILPPLKA